MNKLLQIFRNEEGQAMTEYGLIIALVAIIVAASLTLLQGKLTTLFTNITF